MTARYTPPIMSEKSRAKVPDWPLYRAARFDESDLRKSSVGAYDGTDTGKRERK